MRLADLEPRWMTSHWQDDLSFPNPAKISLTFLCPHCRTQRLGILFKPFIDPLNTVGQMLWAFPGAPDPNTGEARPALFWNREGETFETLTLTPSIDVSQHGHWHGFITAGEVG